MHRAYLKHNLILTYYKLTDTKTARTNLTCYISKNSTAFYFYISIQTFCPLFTCFVFDGLCNIFVFESFVSNIWLLFKTCTKLLTSLCWHTLHQIWIMWNSHIHKFRDENFIDWNTVSADLPYLRLEWIQMFCISHLAFLCFTFHSYLHCSK